MISRGITWTVVWGLMTIISVLAYPTGDSTLMFEFWPTNHLIPWFVTLASMVLGMVFAYDLLFNYYPKEDAEVIEEIEEDLIETESTQRPERDPVGGAE